MSTYDDDTEDNLWGPDSLYMKAGTLAKQFCIVMAGVLPILLFIKVGF